MPGGINYSKWANIDDSDDDDDAAEDVSHLVPAGAETLPDDAVKAFLDELCERTLTQLEAGTGLEICCGALQRSLPGESLEDELKEHVLATHFYFPDCLPPRWRGREQLRLAGEMSARQCISEMLEDLKFGVLTRDSLFKACGNPPGHPEYEKLEERLRLKPNSFLLVIQLAMPDGRGWIETRQLPFKAPRSIDAYIEGSS